MTVITWAQSQGGAGRSPISCVGLTAVDALTLTSTAVGNEQANHQPLLMLTGASFVSMEEEGGNVAMVMCFLRCNSLEAIGEAWNLGGRDLSSKM